ncbi:MAG: serine--tRNA ligase [bacterium]|nr:serine--tRNA ligase [bacterium]
MFDFEFIRNNFELIKRSAELKGESVDVDKFTLLDLKRRDLVKRRDAIRAEQKQISLKVAELKKSGQGDKAEDLIKQSRQLSESESQLTVEITEIETELYTLISWMPNIPDASVPLKTVTTIKEHGNPLAFEFTPKTSDELCESLDMVDFKRSTKVVGSNFPCYKGLGARLERALINFMLDLHIKQGYTEILPSYLVNPKSMFHTGQLPKLEEDMYFIGKDNLFLNPTAEVPVINLFQEEVLDAKDFPIKYVGYTACFRREAGSYGKMTKGLRRLHQFNKVELIKFVHPDSSYQELEILLKEAEEVLKLLGLTYRVILLPVNDMSFASAKTYDIELWAPASKEWLEVSSCSNCEGFQARRAKIRFRDKGEMKTVHILNGSGVATPRLFITLIEQYQTADGGIIIPEVLRPYMGGIDIIDSKKKNQET